MKIAIIGAGFAGLAAAYALAKKNHKVTIFEKDALPGGLAIGFKEKRWQWSIEKHYHHWFRNDTHILQLAKEIKHEVVIKRPKTSVLVDDALYHLDSPIDVLTFPKLSVSQRLRMGVALGVLKYNPFWKPLEKYQACSSLQTLMGERPYKLLWEPLLLNKFGRFANEISLAWFWARIAKRTPTLAYPKGGFLAFASALASAIEKKRGTILLNTEVTNIKDVSHFDKVIVTLPSFLFVKIAPQLPQDYTQKLLSLKGLGAINLILRLKKPFLADGTYWLNICDKNSPIMAIVEHTNFMDRNYYNNEHIVYLGNYLPADHQYMHMDANQLLKIYDRFLQKINPNYQLSTINFQLFKVPFAQPIIPTNYSRMLPPFETPIPNVYLANIQQVYPWDRGTNYAVELGQKVAKLVLNEKL